MRNPFRQAKTVEPESKANTSRDPKHEDENKVRGNWSSQVEFTLSCVGYTVGVGNIWRFPYLCMRNGGGAFLIPYFIFLFFCGMPLYLLELILGQFSCLSPSSVWKICPLLKGLGYGTMIISGIIGMYYNVLLAWILYYLGMSFNKTIPWKTCDNSWNTPNCVNLFEDKLNHSSYHNTSESADLPGRILHNVTSLLSGRRSAAEEFWTYKVLDISSGIEEPGWIKWDLTLCLLVSWILVFICICKGIKSSGKVVYVTATIPYLFLTILLIRGATLPGSLQGIKFYIIPDWAKLLDFKIWAEACLQVFYSLGPAWGAIITLASYNRFHNNVIKDAVIASVSCGGTSFYAGMVIFAAIGYMAHASGQSVDQVITQGPGLAFIAYPDALANLPISQLWAVCFFLMLLSVGLGSQFATIETIASGIADRFPDQLRKRKTLVLLAVIITFFLCDLPFVTRGGMYLFHVIDWYVAIFAVTVFALLECLTVGYFYGIGRFYHDTEMMLQRKLSLMWAICWCGLAPFLLTSMIVVSVLWVQTPTYGEYEYPWWARLLGWLVASAPVVPLPVMAVYGFMKTKGSLLERLQTLIQPEADWGPEHEDYRDQYKYSVRNYSWIDRMSIRKSREILSSVENWPEKVALSSVSTAIDC